MEADICSRCGTALDPADSESWVETVNITNQALFVEKQIFQIDDGIAGPEQRFSWCNRECFMRWVWAKAMVEAILALPEGDDE